MATKALGVGGWVWSQYTARATLEKAFMEKARVYTTSNKTNRIAVLVAWQPLLVTGVHRACLLCRRLVYLKVKVSPRGQLEVMQTPSPNSSPTCVDPMTASISFVFQTRLSSWRLPHPWPFPPFRLGWIGLVHEGTSHAPPPYTPSHWRSPSDSHEDTWQTLPTLTPPPLLHVLLSIKTSLQSVPIPHNRPV